MRIRNLKTYKLKKALYEKDDELNDVLVGYENIGQIQANIQPCRGVQKAQMYGNEITKYLTAFCNPQFAIKEGLYIEVDNVNYMIGPIQKWSHWTFDIKVVI